MATDALEKARRRNKSTLKRWKHTLTIIGLVTMLLSHMGVIPKGHTSILCDDPSIRRIHSTETIPVLSLLGMSSLGPFINILLLEWALPRKSGRSFKQAASCSWRLFRDFFPAQLVLLLVIEFFKMTVSEARPHFMQTCLPNLTEAECGQGYVQLTWENCTNPFNLSKPMMLDTMKSFPSGHAGLGAFIGAYMIWYLLKRIRLDWSQMLAVSVALLWGAWGGVCGVSRIWDNRHHWWDVLVGALLGVAGAYVTIRYQSSEYLKQCRRSSVVKKEPAQQLPS